MGAPVSEGGHAGRRLAKRTVEPGSVLGRVGHDGHLGMTRAVEGGPDRGDPPVHHVGRGNDVGTGHRLADRGAGKQAKRPIIVHLPADQNAAMPMVGVFAGADIRDHQDIRRVPFDGSNRLLHDPIGVVGAAARRILLGWDPKEQHGTDAEFGQVVQFPWQLVHGELELPRHRANFPAHAGSMGHEQGIDKVLGSQRGLPHQAPHRFAAPQPPHPAKWWEGASLPRRSFLLGWHEHRLPHRVAWLGTDRIGSVVGEGSVVRAAA